MIDNQFQGINNVLQSHPRGLTIKYNQLQLYSFRSYWLLLIVLKNHCQKVIGIIHTGSIGIAEALLTKLQATSAGDVARDGGGVR